MKPNEEEAVETCDGAEDGNSIHVDGSANACGGAAPGDAGDELTNFEKLGILGREFFLKYDQTKSVEKFGLEADENYIYLEYLTDECRVKRSTGEMEFVDCDGDAGGGSTDRKRWHPYESPSRTLAIFDLLCHFQDFDDPKLTGEYCSAVSLIVSNANPASDDYYKEYEAAFCEKTGELARACENLGGKIEPRLARADVTCRIPLLGPIDTMLQFWNGDDEFAPKLLFLWDKAILEFMHFETLYYVTEDILSDLREAMGISVE